MVSDHHLKGLVISPCIYEACPNMDREDLGWRPSNAHKPPFNISTWNKLVVMRPLEIAGRIMSH